MSDITLQQVRENVNQIIKNIDTAKILISALSEAGEDTTTLSQNLRVLELRKNKWEQMLINRGL
jgi:hypothetical protein